MVRCQDDRITPLDYRKLYLTAITSIDQMPLQSLNYLVYFIVFGPYSMVILNDMRKFEGTKNT